MLMGGGSLSIAFDVSIDPKWWNNKELGWCVGLNDGNIIGCNFAARKSLFCKVEAFTSNLGRKGSNLLSSEEADFLQRASESCAVILFVTQMVVLHKVYPFRVDLRYILRRAWWQGKSIFVEQHSTFKSIPKVLGNILFGMVLLFLRPNRSLEQSLSQKILHV